MDLFSKEKGSVNVLTLIIIAVLVFCLVFVVLELIKSNQTVENILANQNSTSGGEIDVPDEPDEPIENVDVKPEDFAVEFLKMESKSNNKTNIIYSPLSIKYALNLLKEGAKGNTKEEIENVLGDMSLTKYKNIEDVLSLANGVYIREEFKNKVLDSYNKTVEDKLNAEIMYDDFKSAKNINKWIENKTFGIINNFFDDGDIAEKPELKMILLNALAIDMDWASRFNTDDTSGGIFDKDGSSLNVAYMKKENVYDESISYKIDDDVTVLAMDLEEYDGTTLEFDAIMPNEESLDSFISNIDSKKIDKYLSNLNNLSEVDEDTDINIKIPKFDFDYSINLKNELMAMGIKEAFGYDADFSNITGDTSLFVSDAKHKADIEFSEEGIKAAAVTAMMMNEKMALPNDVVNIDIDKPFMFVIRDKKTGEVWFVGSVYNPVLWDDVKTEYGR